MMFSNVPSTLGDAADRRGAPVRAIIDNLPQKVHGRAQAQLEVSFGTRLQAKGMKGATYRVNNLNSRWAIDMTM